MSEVNPLVPAHAVLDAIMTRRSVRAFTPEPVPRETIETILKAASWAPSGSNIQPWSVHVLTGRTRDKLCTTLLAAHDAKLPAKPDYEYYPKVWTEPFLARRRKMGWELYEALGIGKSDHDASHRYRGSNYEFFGAPVGMIVTMPRQMEAGSWIDLGAFIQTILIAARGFDLYTCAQAAFSNYADLVRETLGLDADQLVICGISLGHADWTHPANKVRASREKLQGFAKFHADE